MTTPRFPVTRAVTYGMSGGGGYGAYGGDCGGGGYGTYDERRGTTTADADNADNRLRSSFLELLRTDDQVPSIIRAITQIDNAAPRDTPHSPHSEVEAVAERGGHDGDDGDDDATTEAIARWRSDCTACPCNCQTTRETLVAKRCLRLE
ncbi:hypothetical protein NFJ02_13g15740 [Pycnococcus provasolii]